MDCISFGKQLLTLRKKCGFTQAALAEKLNVSDKTVSKWETGNGYPEITQLPAIASIFGVSVDALFTNAEGGICVAGNIILDSIKGIKEYPQPGMLSQIHKISRAVGGCVCNVLTDLAKIDRSLTLSALGKVGDDENGRFVLSQMQKYGIDTSNVKVSTTASTAFSDVFNEMDTGIRTFFTNKGANDEFGVDDVNLDNLNCNIFHVGYLLLLKELDSEDPEYGTKMARLLSKVQKSGIKTSIDSVSVNGMNDTSHIIMPALKYCNYTIMNEIEACAACGISPRNSDGSLNRENLYTALKTFIKNGVSEYSVIHCPEAGFACDSEYNITEVPSLKIPPEKIVGATGAGDAFCAGCLYGFYKNMKIDEVLLFAASCAACNLFAENAVDGLVSKEEIYEVMNKYMVK